MQNIFVYNQISFGLVVVKAGGIGKNRMATIMPPEILFPITKMRHSVVWLPLVAFTCLQIKLKETVRTLIEIPKFSMSF